MNFICDYSLISPAVVDSILSKFGVCTITKDIDEDRFEVYVYDWFEEDIPQDILDKVAKAIDPFLYVELERIIF